MQLIDPIVMPVTGETPQQRLDRTLPLCDSPGQQYVESRMVPVNIAHRAGVRFDPDWNGRPAVLVPMYNHKNELCSIHGRYLSISGNQNKMFTIGPGDGMVNVQVDDKADHIILVEGLFDALSLAVCGYSALATVGRRASWLPEICRGRLVVLAFDNNRPGEDEVKFYKQYLTGASFYRLTPPAHYKDWNSALTKRGAPIVAHWINSNLQRHTIANKV
jgi:hypothetical protein